MPKRALMLSLAVSMLIASENATSLAPVSVVATGEEESITKQPVAVSVKEKDEIELDQVIFQKDLFNSLSGVRIEQTGSIFGHMTSIRMPVNTGPYYLFMQDGIPVQSSGFFNHNGLAYTTFGSSASVEVLKGAGTALYGSDAVAAVIDVKSLEAPSKTKEVKIGAMGGSYGYGSLSAEVSAPTGEESGYRANAKLLHSDGWRDHTTSERAEMNLRYDTSLNENNILKVIFNASKTDAEQADSFNDYANIESGSKAASDDPNYFKALELTDVKRKFDYARLSAEISNYSYENLEMSFTPYLRYNRNRYVATWNANLPRNDNKLKTVGLLQRNRYDTSWGRIIGGIDLEYTKSDLKYVQDFDINVTSWSGTTTYLAGDLYDYSVDYVAVAPYIHTDIDLSKELTASFGLRYDYNRYDYTNNLAPNSYDASGKYFRPADRTDNFSHLSPKFALSYQADENSNIYFRYANGFRIPQASRLYSMQKGYEEVTLDPETSNTFEIGYKRAFSTKSYAEIAVYYMSIDDTIVRYINDINGDYYYDNGGNTIHRGVEFTLAVQMSSEWSAKVAYSYSRHNYDRDPTYGENEMGQAPNHLGNLRLFYSPENIKGLKIMGEFQYVGPWWTDDAHDGGKYDGYSVGNLKADYKFDSNWRFFAKVMNITDEKYATRARFAYGKYDYTPADPREFYAGLEYRW
ncbi:MAG: TonB-dependent receptor [Hydrogenimonas sp.]|nr:TonB-dependent receptor [Hydrogenimonas sp.]